MGYSWFDTADGGNGFWTTSNDVDNWFSYGDIQTAITFEVTSEGQELAGYKYWWDSAVSEALVPGGFALWGTLVSDTGTVVSGSVITSIPTPTVTGWQYVALETPIALTINTPYRMEFAASGGFFWAEEYSPFTGAGIVVGPVNVYSDNTGTNPMSTGSYNDQGSFATSTNVPGSVYPVTGYETGAPAIDALIQASASGVNVSGVAAEIVLAGGVGSVTADVAVNVSGVAAAIVLAGGVGAALAGASVLVAGVAAEIVLTGGVGSVTADASINISGVAAEIVLAGGVGTVTADASINISGVAAEIVLAGGIGAALAGASAQVVGVSAQISLNAGVGAVTANAAVNISGVAAEIVMAGGVGTVTADASVNVTGVAAEIVLACGVGTVTADASVNVTGVAAEIVLTGGVGAVTATSGGYSWFDPADGGNGYWESFDYSGVWSSYADMQTAITFEVTEDNQLLSGYKYLWDSVLSEALEPGGFALWGTLTSAPAGVVVDNSVVTSIPTPTETGWQYVALETPIALIKNTPYKIEFAASGGFFWATGYAPFASGGLTNGPIVVFTSQTSDGGDGGANAMPTNLTYNGSFSTVTNVPGETYPTEGYYHGAPAIDVLIQTAALDVNVPGVAAEFDIAGGVGTVTADVSVDISGVAAAITLAGGVGVVVTAGSVHVSGVAAEFDIDAGVGSVTALQAAIVSGVAAEIIFAGGTGYGMLEITFSSSAFGIDTYTTFSEINNTDNAGNQDMRVLPPVTPNTSYEHAFLWMLPVEAGQGTTFGDSMQTIADLAANDNFNLTCIQPGYPIDPWYGNNPDDPQTRQVDFLLQLVAWAKQSEYAVTGTEKHYIIGFSKSGFGGQTVFMQHQDIFSGVISWDAACDLQLITDYGGDADDSFGDQTALDSSILYDPNLTTWKALGDTGSVNRIQLAAGINLVEPTSDYASRLTADGILNTYTYVETDSHQWAPTPGWVGPNLLRLLGSMSATVSGVAAEITLTGGVGSVLTGAAVDISGVAAEITLTGGVGSVTADVAVNISGVAAQIVLAGGVGFVSTSASVDISGIAAEFDIAAGIGTVYSAADIAGVAAAIVITGGIGVVTAQSAVDISGIAAVIAIAGGRGSLPGAPSNKPSSLFVFASF